MNEIKVTKTKGVANPDGDLSDLQTSYEITAYRETWTLRKEFYAAGISMFEWVLETPNDEMFEKRFSKKKNAINWLKSEADKEIF